MVYLRQRNFTTSILITYELVKYIPAPKSYKQRRSTSLKYYYTTPNEIYLAT